MVSDHQTKLKAMRTLKVKDQGSIETKIFSVLKEIGVELSAYHGGSLNGKDIKKVMNNACHIFDRFSTIFKGGKRRNCALSDANIDALCLQFREVFVLWDGVFSLARTINPTERDTSIYRMYVDAAVKGSKDLQCTVTPKVHLMLEHVEWQMTNIEGGLGDKMEDWVELLHQTGKRQRLRYRTVQNPVVCSLARADLVGVLRKKQRDFGRFEAMKYFKQDDNKRLTWSAPIFNDAKEGASNADGIEHLCHLEKELSSTKL